MINQLFLKTSLFLFGALTVVPTINANPDLQLDLNYLSIEQMEWNSLSEEETLLEISNFNSQTSNVISNDVVKPQFTVEEFNTLVLIGEKIYNLVKKGQPVLNVETQTWSVLPKNVTEASALSDWKNPVRKGYSFSAENGYGVEVINVRYIIQFVPGGRHEGKGAYLAHISAIPTTVDVAWGYTLNITAESREPLNVGSPTNPVAAFSTDVKIEVKTLVKRSIKTLSTFMTGDGEISPASL